MKYYLLILSLLCLMLQSSYAAVHSSQEQTMAPSVTRIFALGMQYSPSQVLVVYDIDNTLLTPPSGYALGSSQWWIWQAGLLATHPDSKYLVAHKFKRLIKIADWLMACAQLEMVPDPNFNADTISNLQRRHYHVMALTARDSMTINTARLQLLSNGIDLSRSALKFSPFDPAIGHHILRDNAFKRPIYYRDGIALDSGQNKGLALQLLLKHFAKQGKMIKAIVFIDDDQRNINAVNRAFLHTNIDVYTFQYNLMMQRVNNFLHNRNNAQDHALAQWQNIKQEMPQ